MVRRPPTAVAATRAAIPVETPEAAEIAAVAIAVVEATSLSETKGWGRKPHPSH